MTYPIARGCRIWGLVLFILLLTAINTQVSAYEPLVEKRVFEIEKFRTQGDEVIRNVRVGWESYGTLNDRKDNVILITHFFSGTSHAAGRYSQQDAVPGYWDAIIGSGKAIDTDKYFVISVDTLVNLNVHDPNVVTTGPASINPETGMPYAMSFPIVTIRDFVEVQKELLDSLGVKKLHAVMGASMGSLQAYEWASAYPDRVERLIPVIGSGWATGDLIAWLNIWASPIRLDPDWNKGDYYNGTPPTDGLTEALKIATLQAQHWEWSNEEFGRAWADSKADPADAYENQFLIEATLQQLASVRARRGDANHFLYLVKACQLFHTGTDRNGAEALMRIKAPALIIHQEEDLIFPGDVVRDTASLIRGGGVPVQIVELSGTHGHMDGVLSIGQASMEISHFLMTPVP